MIKSKWFVAITTAVILSSFFLLDEVFLAFFTAACFVPLIFLKLKESGQDLPTLKEQAKYYRDFILLVLLFCFWLAGSLIEN